LTAPATAPPFAQPSGLASDGKRLFVADSEASIIRSVDLPETGDRVRTLAGGDLFEFGDKDGTGGDARLQHPLGVAWDGARVLIADTYNHKIKTLDPATGRVETWLGGGRGDRDGDRPSSTNPAACRWPATANCTLPTPTTTRSASWTWRPRPLARCGCATCPPP
jgi:sugar lactone lactonase YvrE